MRTLLPLALALAALACSSTRSVGFQPEPGDFARLHLETTDTDVVRGPRDRQLRTRLMQTFGDTLEVSVGGRTALVRVAEPRELDWSRINRDCEYTGFRLDVLAIEADVSVVDGVLVFSATGQSVPLEQGSQTPDLPPARRWVRILGAAPAWPFGGRVLEGEPRSGASWASGSVSVSASASGG